MANKFYWKGVQFSTSSKPPSLQHVSISEAYDAIKGSAFLPNLYHVTVDSSVFGVISDELTSPLTISNSSIRKSVAAGIRIKSGLVPITIENTQVDYTTSGDGLSYSGILHREVDFCSADASNITFPITFQALGNSSTKVDCGKVRKLICYFSCPCPLYSMQNMSNNVGHGGTIDK